MGTGGASVFALQFAPRAKAMLLTSPIVDDLSLDPPMATLGTRWRIFTDRVMGGVSQGTMSRECVAGRPAIRMRGNVSLANNGGFVQMSLDLDQNGEPVNVSSWHGIALDVLGNDETYAIHLRTADLSRPWQSYRQSFKASPEWRVIELPFKEFQPHRTDVALDVSRLKRLGVVAIGRQFEADISIGGVRFLEAAND